MSLENLWNWAVDNMLVWFIIGLVVWRAADGLKDGKTGQVVWSIILGAFAWYFVENPQTVLNKAGEIIGKIFG